MIVVQAFKLRAIWTGPELCVRFSILRVTTIEVSCIDILVVVC